MAATVTLPIWFVLLIVLLAAWAVLDRLLIPSVRWAARRRANRTIDELNTRLHLQIQPFKLTKRQVLIDRVLFDPQVLQAIDAHARETGEPREVVMHTAQLYAHEIVPSFSAYAYFRVGIGIARRLSRMLYRVRIGYANEDALRSVEANAAVVFVINHRSNMDYVLVTYVAASASALSYAVGEWAQVWLLRSLIRSMGAYFIRRQSRNALYRKVLARYVHMATQAGVTQAVFPEGGLSRDGALRPPKLGLLSYMVSEFDPNAERDIVFIPVGVNYDRVLEDRILTAGEMKDTERAAMFRFSPWIFCRYLAHSMWLGIRGRWYRYGYTCVSFGAPISLRAHLAQADVDFRDLEGDNSFAAINQLGDRLMQAVGRVVPVLPVSLVATVLMNADSKGLSLFDLKGHIHSLVGRLERAGAYIHIPRADWDYALEVGLRMLKLRNLVEETDGHFRAHPGEHVLLRYYANSIAHLIE
jgi:glycerol-3-phosphate O-acyltransferase